MKPLKATVEQNGAFWVRKDTQHRNQYKCLKWTGSDIESTYCAVDKLSVVCQKEL